jgi:hypothetical protein
MTQPTHHPAAVSCLGAPAGFESPCGIIAGPHGPHGPLPTTPQTSTEETQQVRARKIAAIHALADWYARTPDAPMPSAVLAYSVTYGHNAPEADRVAQVLAFARVCDVAPKETRSEVATRFNLREQEGMTVTVSMSAVLSDDLSAKRYVP